MVKVNQRGNGSVSDLLSKIKDGRYVSRGLGIIPHPAAQVLSSLAQMAGYGKRKRVVRRKKVMKGAGFFSDILREVGSGVGGGVGNLARGLFGGAKRKVRRRVPL
jgi:hypothetical protein